jgi:hypothetical protein
MRLAGESLGNSPTLSQQKSVDLLFRTLSSAFPEDKRSQYDQLMLSRPVEVSSSAAVNRWMYEVWQAFIKDLTSAPPPSTSSSNDDAHPPNRPLPPKPFKKMNPQETVHAKRETRLVEKREKETSHPEELFSVPVLVTSKNQGKQRSLPMLTDLSQLPPLIPLAQRFIPTSTVKKDQQQNPKKTMKQPKPLPILTDLTQLPPLSTVSHSSSNLIGTVKKETKKKNKNQEAKKPKALPLLTDLSQLPRLQGAR